ncbi:MAG: hypothetical protein JWP69_2245 [Flaviaesturariibacter sp.]|nr:hypothetical protein [Flaviaesturariibacter sp.]
MSIKLLTPKIITLIKYKQERKYGRETTGKRGSRTTGKGLLCQLIYPLKRKEGGVRQ